MSQEAKQQIGRMIKARCPIIGVQSHEEARVLDALLDVAREQGKGLRAWSISQGMMPLYPVPPAGREGEQARKDALELRDPIKALQWVIAQGETAPDGDPAIYVFKDLHSYITGPNPDAVIIRALRDAAATLPYHSRGQTIILLSPTLDVPNDLEKDTVVVDFPLPDAKELAEALETFIANLPDTVDVELNGERQQIIRALQGLTRAEADAVLAQATIALGHLGADCIPHILDAKRAIIRKSGALEFYPEQATDADIGGLDLLKAWCKASAGSFSAEAEAYGLEPDRALMIVGVPGCGKSLTAKRVAGGTRPLLRFDIGAVFGSLLGQSETQTRNALKVAEAIAPCVLWIDEIEKALGSGGGELDGGTTNRVLGTILTWMEETKAPVFIVATANDVSRLRPELMRRFSEIFFVDVPRTGEEAVEILAIHLRKRGRKPGDFDLEKVAEHCVKQEFTGAELEKVVQMALRMAFTDGQREVTTDDLMVVAEATVPLAHSMAEQIADMRSWATRALPASSRQESGRPTQPAERVRKAEFD